MGHPYYNKRLANKLKEVNPDAFDKMRCGLIENEIRESGYPSENAELAILRKQIKHILDVLNAQGIYASTDEFIEFNQVVEASKSDINDLIK